MTTPALDRDRLLADLDRVLADLRVGWWPERAARYWRLRGFEQGLQVIRAAIEDGDYDDDGERESKLLRCPAGCSCIFPDDPDMHECACDGLCTTEAWDDLRVSLEEAERR